MIFSTGKSTNRSRRSLGKGGRDHFIRLYIPRQRHAASVIAAIPQGSLDQHCAFPCIGRTCSTTIDNRRCTISRIPKKSGRWATGEPFPSFRSVRPSCHSRVPAFFLSCRLNGSLVRSPVSCKDSHHTLAIQEAVSKPNRIAVAPPPRFS
jgi:hypothetical protein